MTQNDQNTPENPNDVVDAATDPDGVVVDSAIDPDGVVADAAIDPDDAARSHPLTGDADIRPESPTFAEFAVDIASSGPCPTPASSTRSPSRP